MAGSVRVQHRRVHACWGWPWFLVIATSSIASAEPELGIALTAMPLGRAR